MKLAAIIVLFGLTACSASTPPPVEKATKRSARCSAYEGKKAPFKFIDFEHDKNGTISRDEFLCQIPIIFEALDKEKDRHLDRREAKRHWWLWKADRNGDSFVHLIEFMQAGDAAFQRADKDKSGDLSVNEFVATFPTFR